MPHESAGLLGGNAIHDLRGAVRVQMVYSSLPNFEEKEEDFRAESVLLRRRFTDESMFSTQEDHSDAVAEAAIRWLMLGGDAGPFAIARI